MISVKNAAQIDKMRAAGRLLYEVLTALRPMIVPGAATIDIDRAAHRMIMDAGAKPSFLGYKDFPNSLCTSVNEVVVHGIPNGKPLVEGDILGVDCGVILDGWQSDSAFTAGVGRISREAQRLIDVTEQCFWKAVASSRKGARIGDIGFAVQSHAEANGYQPIRAMCGHGIGRKMHEDPEVPNYGERGHGFRLLSGMTIAIEPMIAAGGWEIDINGWDVVTRDHSLCAHYEHTILITDGEPEVLSLPQFARGEGGS
ncbi:MAG: type I methionyl aminopeptidase [Oscillospiraceae bacterium]|jgi:methionyl aminopeptidase|nr:type I methionyl aminopeptidase [Oscillospiraceae bacterium]